MHGLDCSWSELFLLAPHPTKRGWASRLSLRNTKALSQNRTPLAAGVRVLTVLTVPRAASATVPWISLPWAPEVLTHHTTGDSMQESPSQGWLYETNTNQTIPFHPIRYKIAVQEPQLLCVTASYLEAMVLSPSLTALVHSAFDS